MQRELPCCFLKREDEERDDDDGRDERRKERLRGRFSFRALEQRTLLPALERHGAAGAALPRHGSVEALPVNSEHKVLPWRSLHAPAEAPQLVLVVSKERFGLVPEIVVA